MRVAICSGAGMRGGAGSFCAPSARRTDTGCLAARARTTHQPGPLSHHAKRPRAAQARQRDAAGHGWSARGQEGGEGRRRSVARRLVLTAGALLERRPATYEVAERRQLAALAALVRSSPLAGLDMVKGYGACKSVRIDAPMHVASDVSSRRPCQCACEARRGSDGAGAGRRPRRPHSGPARPARRCASRRSPPGWRLSGPTARRPPCISRRTATRSRPPCWTPRRRGAGPSRARRAPPPG